MASKTKNIPHGHGKSHKKGVADGLLGETIYADSLPNGHQQSYQRGRTEGKQLRRQIAKRVRPERINP